MKESEYFMSVALGVARSGFGLTGENPSVGAVIVRDNNILSIGRTSDFGRPHAEINAMGDGDYSGADLYVTLEPCSHYGKTPPCVEKVILAGFKRVFVGITDPDDRVNGRGIKMMQDAGIDVSVGILAHELNEFYSAYIFAKRNHRPLVTAKISMTLDAKVATSTGESKWISSDDTRRYTNYMRHKYDGILVGSGTYKKDSPLLNCRINGLEKYSPKRYLMSRSILTADGFKIVHDDKIINILEKIYKEDKVNNLLVEGGANVISAFINQGYIDRILVITSLLLIGKSGLSGLDFLGHNKLIDAIGLSLLWQKRINDDFVAEYLVKK